MEITEIKVFPIGEEKLKAFVSIVFDECFMVNDIKVIQGKDGFFISMPSRRKRNGRFKDVAHPLNNETRQWIEGRILAEYDRVLMARGEKESPAEMVEEEVSQEVVKTASEPAPKAQAEPIEPEADKSLEEVAEMHLRDSFWNS